MSCTFQRLPAMAKGSDKLGFVPEAGVGAVPRGDGGVHRGRDLRVRHLVLDELHVQPLRHRVVPVKDRVVDPLPGQFLRAHLGVGEIRFVVEHHEVVSAVVSGGQRGNLPFLFREGFRFRGGRGIPGGLANRFRRSITRASGEQDGQQKKCEYPFFHEYTSFPVIIGFPLRAEGSCTAPLCPCVGDTGRVTLRNL